MHSTRTWGFKTVKSDREQEHRRSGNRARPGSLLGEVTGQAEKGCSCVCMRCGSCVVCTRGRWPRRPRLSTASKQGTAVPPFVVSKKRRRAAPAGGSGPAREVRTVRVPGEAPSCRPARDAFQSHAPSPGCRARPVPSLCGHHTRRPKCSDLSARAAHLGAADVPGSKVSGGRRGAEMGTGDGGPSRRGMRWGRGGPGSATPAGITSVRGLGNARVCVPKEPTSRTRRCCQQRQRVPAASEGCPSRGLGIRSGASSCF